MDRILETYLSDFAKEQNIEHLEKSQAFELFVNFTVLSRIHAGPFDIESTSVGGRNDNSIDGIAILVNDHIVTTKEEVEYFKKTLRRLDVRFVFVQSKTSEKFEMGPIGNFLFGVKNFFEQKSSISANPQVQNLRGLKDYVYDQSLDMNQNPVCELFYATTGVWTGDKNLLGRVQPDIQSLRDTKLFSEVKFTWLDDEMLKKHYRELRNKVVKQITFDKHTTAPSIQGVLQAYIGILPGKEYLKLITDDEGYLQRNLFYDNVRDFQGNNPVNMEIADTIKDSTHNDLFTLLNNGITVVAKSINQVGNTFTLRDYQVVNGCQTSHVLYLNKEEITDRIYIPVKLIVTDNVEITSRITRATNRQTAVQVEAFESLQPFHKELEEFYNSFKNEKPLYYERRSKQYDGLQIPLDEIISIPLQTYSFMAMFLNEPHSTHRYYGEILKANENRMFVEGHSPYPYYISGYASHLLWKFILTKKISPKYKVFRYHMLMLFRLLAEQSELPYINSKKIEKYCLDLRSVLWNEEVALNIFQKAAQISDEALQKSAFGTHESARRRTFTEDLINLVKKNEPRIAIAQLQHGIVKWFSEVKGYGFIQGENVIDDIFVHYSDVRGDGYKTLVEGEKVEFQLVETDRGLSAKDVVSVSGG